MIPSARLVALVAAGALPLAAGLWWPAWMPAALAYNALIAVLATADLLAQPRQPVDAGRQVDDVLSVGVANPVRVRVRSRARRPLEVVIRDLPPFTFQSSHARLRLRVDPGETREATYHVTPPARGRYVFGDLYLRLRSPLGLWVRTLPVRAAQTVKVYPNLVDVRRYDLLARRGRLLEAGLRTTRRFGEGTEFEALREGRPDDSFRRINWKATARRARVIVNEYDVERSQTVMLLFDTGRLMSGEIREPGGPVRSPLAQGLTKLDVALNAGLMAARVAATYDDRVGMLAFSHRVHAYVAPRKGPGHLLRLLDALYALEADLGEPDYALMAQHLSQRLRRRSLLLVFTDLIDPVVSSRLLGHLAALARKHLVMFVTIADPVTAAAAAALPEGADAAYRKAAAARALDGRDDAVAFLGRRGVVVVDRPPDALTLGVVNTYIELKAKSRV